MFLSVPLQGRPGPEGSPGAKGYPGRQVQYMASGSSVAMVVRRWPWAPGQREVAGWGLRTCTRWGGPRAGVLSERTAETGSGAVGVGRGSSHSQSPLESLPWDPEVAGAQCADHESNPCPFYRESS